MGQWGNQITQHIVAKILAERTGQFYKAQPWLNKAGELLKWNMQPYLVPTSTQGEKFGMGPLTIDVQHWFNIENVFPGWEIDATGFFQRYELFAPYRDKIRREWLPIRRELPPSDDDAVYIHVRRTDYLGDHLSPERNCQATTMDEYAACIKLFPDARKIVLVSDDYNDPFLRNFCHFGVPVESHPNATWDSDWLTLASCKNLIMSQSTYSWWAAFIGRAQKIVCPVFDGTFWGNGRNMYGPPKDGRDFPNLCVKDDPGKEWVWLSE